MPVLPILALAGGGFLAFKIVKGADDAARGAVTIGLPVAAYIFAPRAGITGKNRLWAAGAVAALALAQKAA